MERTPDYVEYRQKGRGLTLDQIIERKDLTMLTMTQISKRLGVVGGSLIS